MGSGKESINRHNAMIEKANARLESLWAANVRASASMCANGVTITIERPGPYGRHSVTVSHEIIPY